MKNEWGDGDKSCDIHLRSSERAEAIDSETVKRYLWCFYDHWQVNKSTRHSSAEKVAPIQVWIALQGELREFYRVSPKKFQGCKLRAISARTR
jgi:hypothetical protein